MPPTKDAEAEEGDRPSLSSMTTTTTSSLAPSSSLTALGSPLNRKRAYKYVKPRIGSHFQCMVPPRPTEGGDGGKDDQSDLERDCKRETVPKRRKAGRPSKRGRLANTTSSHEPIQRIDPPISRGGLCIHKPTLTPLEDTDAYLTHNRNLLLQTPRDWNHASARASRRMKHLVTQPGFGSIVEEKTNQGGARGRKRKLKEGRSSSASPVPKGSRNRKESGPVGERPETLGLEDDVIMLEFLQVTHGGNIDQAQFMNLVQLCRGRAVKSRTRLRKARKRDEMTVPLSAVLAPLSDSWRRRYERSGSTFMGDLRRNAGEATYPYFGVSKEGWDEHEANDNLYPWSVPRISLGSRANDTPEKKESTQAQHSNPFEDVNDEMHKLGWRTLLEWAQSVLITSNSSTVNSNGGGNGNGAKGRYQPRLQDLLVILTQAYALPKPEDVFGRRDTISKQISQCLNSILDLIDVARDFLAFLVDALYDTTGEGIDVLSVRKGLQTGSSKVKVHVNELGIVRVLLDEADTWEAKLESGLVEDEDGEYSASSEDLNLPRQSLLAAEELALEGRKLSVRPKSWVALDQRIDRAYALRNRIRLWSKNNSDSSDNVKYITSMIKEANSINLGFTELSILSKVHRNAEEWMDRASVALRSKISLRELESLVKTGEKMPVGLSGTLGKLKVRYDQVCDWIAKLKMEVPCPLENISASACDLDAGNRAEWFFRMRKTLYDNNDDNLSTLTELSGQGSRLPVDIDFLQLLQTAIDSRTWSMKAKRWVPDSGDFRRGKIDDIKDHLSGAHLIRNKAKSLTQGKTDFTLNYEIELLNIVEEADKWFEKYRPYVEGDGRKSSGRRSISFKQLKQIVEEDDLIPANLGNPSIKMNRIYSQAKSWIDDNIKLLLGCGVEIRGKPTVEDATDSFIITIEEVKKAIESSVTDLSVDLDEARQLKEKADKSQDWFDRSLLIAPKRNKRNVRGKHADDPKHTISEVAALIEEASGIPMNTCDDVERLRMVLSDVQSWRLQAQSTIRDISLAFNSLREERVAYYGLAETFSLDLNGDENDDAQNDGSMTVEDSTFDSQESESKSSTSKQTGATSVKSNVYKMITNLRKSATSMSIHSLEEELSESLETTTRWCRKAANIIGSPNDVFHEKRWTKDLKNLIEEGKKLKALPLNEFDASLEEDEKVLLNEISKHREAFISDDVVRLEILHVHQKEYRSWCDRVKKVLSENERKIPFNSLKKLAEESRMYPPNADTVKQVRKDAIAATKWVRAAKEKVNSKEAISLSEAKKMLDTGSRLRFTCEEYKYLRKEYQSAKAWEKKVKKSGIEDGSAQIYEIRELIKTHDSFSITMPEELTALTQAMCGYCICRRPYEGFMIGCDECDEWYHGSCIGMSQAQGEKIEKYVCVRCCVKKVYKNASNSLALVIRKWCDNKELNRARSIDSQKHQRKVREKKREHLRWNEDLTTNKIRLKEIWDEDRKKEIRLQKPDVCNVDISNFPVDAIDTLNQYSVHLGLTTDEIEKLAQIKCNVLKATSSLDHCNRRVEELSKVSFFRKVIQEEEDQLLSAFRYWVVLLRTRVIAPETMLLANESRPSDLGSLSNPEDLLSTPMNDILELAKKLGISKFPDVELVKNSFQCVAWCLYAFSVLQKKPKFEDVKCLVRLGGNIKLPEVKSLGMVRSMISRTTPWQVKVNKALSSISGTTQRLDSGSLKELLAGVHSIPIITEEERKLYDALEEGGTHVDRHSYEDISKHAPDPIQMWPPFGLSNTPEAVTALGNSLKVKIEQFRLSTPTTSSSNVGETQARQEDRGMQQDVRTQSKQAGVTKKGTNGQILTNSILSANHTRTLQTSLNIKTGASVTNGKHGTIPAPQPNNQNATCENKVPVLQGLSEEDAATAARIVANVMKRCKTDTSPSLVNTYNSSPNETVISVNGTAVKSSPNDSQMTYSRVSMGKIPFGPSHEETLSSESRLTAHQLTDGNSTSLHKNKVGNLLENLSQEANSSGRNITTDSSLTLSLINSAQSTDPQYISLERRIGTLQNVTSMQSRDIANDVAVPLASVAVRTSTKIVEVGGNENALTAVNAPASIDKATQQSLVINGGTSNDEKATNTNLIISQIIRNASPTKEHSIEIEKDIAVPLVPTSVVEVGVNENALTAASIDKATQQLVINVGTSNVVKATNTNPIISQSVPGNNDSPTKEHSIEIAKDVAVSLVPTSVVEVGVTENTLTAANPPASIDKATQQSLVINGGTSNDVKATNTNLIISQSVPGNNDSPTKEHSIEIAKDVAVSVLVPTSVVEVGVNENALTAANPPASIDKATQQSLVINGGISNDVKATNTNLIISQSVNALPTKVPSPKKTTCNNERIYVCVNSTTPPGTNQITAPNP